MDTKILDSVLAADKRVRYVGALDRDLKTVASKAREYVKRAEGKEHADDLLVNLAAPVVLGTLSRFADKCGKLICAGVRYDEVTLIFFKMGECM